MQHQRHQLATAIDDRVRVFVEKLEEAPFNGCATESSCEIEKVETVFTPEATGKKAERI